MSRPRAPASAAWDEARDEDGRVRPAYAAVLGALDEAGVGVVARETAASARETGIAVGGGEGARPLPVDAVPRVVEADEWADLAGGLVQRARLLEVLASVDPEGDDVLATSHYREPDLEDVPLRDPPLAVVGFDVVRAPDGRFALLEENLLTPGHVAVPAARDVVALARRLPGLAEDVHGLARRLLREALGAGEGGDGDGDVAILADRGGAQASWEVRWLGRFLDLPVLGLDEVRGDARGVVVRRDGRRLRTIWYRTAEDRLRADDGSTTALGDVLLAPLRAGTVHVVNRPGCGVADDKRLLARGEELVRDLLDEPPALAVLPTLDLAVAADRAAALAEPRRFVFKPRHGAGGRGVVIGAHATERVVAEVVDAVEREPDGWVAQEYVPLSLHPTVAGERLVARPVDLRAFAIRGAAGWEVLPGGVSRYPVDRDAPIVNTSAGGGIKDVWVLRDGGEAW